ncbi:BAG family molecular chaperone regulator 1 [Platanthera guangdongensis]|uniref:BAG family molecular chaperone regulator 1 n=1 Tax=Platanthera guangdongensis TaxID=2320717 RepID=A0ABR2M388_9ASPA
MLYHNEAVLFDILGWVTSWEVPIRPSLTVEVDLGGRKLKMILDLASFHLLPSPTALMCCAYSQKPPPGVRKLLWKKTGIHHREQKLLFKERESASRAYLYTAGINDGSRLIMEEDLTTWAKHLPEMRRNARADRVAKLLVTITVAIDGPVSKVGIITEIKPLLPLISHDECFDKISQVSEMEAVVNRGELVVEKEDAELIDQLMIELLRLKEILVEEI